MFKTALVPIDMDVEQSWRLALPVAEQFTANWGTKVHALSVIPSFGTSLVGSYFPKNFEGDMLSQARGRLDEIIDQNASDPGAVSRHIAHGTVYEEILAAAETLQADVIVMTSHRPELKDYLLGPNAARVMRHSNQSVFIIREEN